MIKNPCAIGAKHFSDNPETDLLAASRANLSVRFKVEMFPVRSAAGAVGVGEYAVLGSRFGGGEKEGEEEEKISVGKHWKVQIEREMIYQMGALLTVTGSRQEIRVLSACLYVETIPMHAFRKADFPSLYVAEEVWRERVR